MAEWELDAFADLIRLEDRRDYDEERLQGHASATSARVRARAALTLGRLRNSAGAPILLRLLGDADTATAATAAFSLGQLGDSSHTGVLSAILEDSRVTARPTVASEAAYALGKIGGAAARDALLSLLARRPLTDRAGAATVGSALLAVWKLPAADDLAPVTRWLDAPDPELRWRAAYALGRRPDSRALPPLRRALEDSDPRVRSLSLRGLSAAMADSAGVPRDLLIANILPLLRMPEYEVSISAARVLGSYSELPVVDALAAAASAPSSHLAITALESLGRIGATARDRAGAIAAIAMTDSVPIAVRATALEALARIDSATASATASALAAAPAWRLRAAAARTFALVKGHAGIRFDALLRDADPRVAGAALQAVVDAAGDSVAPLRPLLIEQLGAPDAIVRSTALTALARIADPSLLPLLLDAYGRAQRDTLNDAALAAVDAIAAVERDGTQPARAFFARFPRSEDGLVRVRVAERFDSATSAASWGPPLPLETGRSPADYRALVEELVAPVLRDEPAAEVAIVSVGDTIVLRLFSAEAPLTVRSFLDLAARGFFDGQEWPRVVANFVVQGGDPRGDTSGGPGYSIRDEISRHRYGTGTLGMALAGPDTGGSQFFVTHSPQPHLDGTYAVFGEVIAGQRTIETILPAHTIDQIRRLP